ncbi:MAG: HEAT repeat domain-containing protein [Treponema sp.]|nr:HEAT repeat domain-containing protein [Treponema sp.]
MRLSKYGTSVVCGLLLCATAFAQEEQQQKETSVESEYMQSTEDQIITELAGEDDRENKELALLYLKEAVEGGRITPDVMTALDTLAGEGVTTQVTMRGRKTNNMPDIRKQACDLLATIHTEEAKDSLKNIALADNEPMVLAAAVRGLGEIGINEKDEVVDAIAWVQKKNSTLNPTSSLAFEVLVAYEKLADTVENKTTMLESIAKIAGNNRYPKVVQKKARDLLKKLQQTSSDSGK